MFRSAIEDSAKAWFYFESFTLPYYCQLLQKKIIQEYSPFQYIVDIYSKKVKREICPITEEYLEKNPSIQTECCSFEERNGIMERSNTHYRCSCTFTLSLFVALFQLFLCIHILSLEADTFKLPRCENLQMA